MSKTDLGRPLSDQSAVRLLCLPFLLVSLACSVRYDPAYSYEFGSWVDGSIAVSRELRALQDEAAMLPSIDPRPRLEALLSRQSQINTRLRGSVPPAGCEAKHARIILSIDLFAANVSRAVEGPSAEQPRVLLMRVTEEESALLRSVISEWATSTCG